MSSHHAGKKIIRAPRVSLRSEAASIQSLKKANEKLRLQLLRQQQRVRSFQQGEQRMKAVFDSAFQFIALLRPDGKVLEVNQSALKFGGLTPSDVQGEFFWDCRWWTVSREVRWKLRRAVAQAARGKFVRYPVEVLGKRGGMISIDFSLKPIKDKQGRVTLLTAEGRDITDRKRMEEALEKSRERYQIVADNAYGWETWMDPQGKYLYISPACEEITGYSRERFKSSEELERKIVFRDDRSAFARHQRNAMREKGERSIEFRIVHRDGTVRWIQHVCRPVYGKQGCYLGVRGSNCDITDKKRAEENLRESELRFRCLFESSQDAMMTLEPPSWRFASANSAMARMFRTRNVSELCARSPWELSPKRQPDGRASSEKAKEMIREALRNGSNFFEWTHLRIKGESFPAEVLLTRVKTGDRVFLQATVRDITERKQANELFRKSESRFRSYFELPLNGIAITSPEKGWIQVNDRVCDILGYPRKELLRKTWAEMTHPEDLGADNKQFKRLLSGAIERYTMEKRFIRKDGTTVWTSLAVGCVRKPEGKVDYVCALIEDIAERKKAEALLKQREAFLTSIIDNQSGMVWLKDGDSRILAVNQVFARMAGKKTSGEAVGKTDLDLWPRKLANKYRADDRKVMRTRKHVTVEELISENGIELWHETFKTPVFDADGKVIGTTGYARDITELKKTEHVLRESEEKFRVMFETSVSGMALCEMDGTIVQVNQAYLNIIGYSRKEALKLTYWDLTPKEYEKAEAKQFRLLEKTGKYGPYEKEYIRKTGERIPVLLNGATVVGEDGKKRIWSVVMDITESKRVSEELFKSRQMLQNILDAVPQRIFWKDVNSVYGGCNHPFAADCGYKTPGDLVGKNDHEITSSSLADGYRLDDQKVIRLGRPRLNYEELRVKKDGNQAWLRISKIPLRDKNGKITGVLGTYEDITEQKLAEKALRDSEFWLKESQRVSHIGSYELDVNNGVWKCSGALNEIFGIGQDYKKDIEGWRCIVHPADREAMMEYLKLEVLGRRNRFNREYRICRSNDGKIRWVLGRGLLALDSRGVPEKMIGTIQDITDRKELELALEKRILALTQPEGEGQSVVFEDLFNLEEIQKIQDEFTKATGVASIITHTDGNPITKPSNFCSLCNDIIRKTEKGLVNCYRSDACIGRPNPGGPIVQPCLSGGLWDAGASISVGGRHIANWLIGQVRDETQSEDKIRAYAREIGADEEKTVEAFRKVPPMSRDQFDKVAQLLFIMAKQLSQFAFQNLQQARAITGSRRAEELIRAGRHQLFQVIDTVPHMIFSKDKQGRFLLVNKAVGYMYGMDPKSLIGKKRQEIHPVAEEANAYLNVDEEVLRTGNPKVIPNDKFTDARGSVHIMQTIKIPFKMVGSEEECILGVSVDMTEQRKVEEFRNEIIRTVSHELRTPLSIEKEGISILMDEILGPVNPEQKEILETVMRSIDRLSRMITGLLDMSRIETGKAELYLKKTSLEDLAREAVLEFRERAKTKGIELKLNLPESRILLLADADKITQVLSNLVDNAIKFTPENGCVQISVAAQKDYVECSVEDNGLGISNENMLKLFEKFQQFSRTAGPGEKGFGLGLSIVKGIIDMHGGRSWAQSELGKGTRVTFSLPRRDPEAVADSSKSETIQRKKNGHPGRRKAR